MVTVKDALECINPHVPVTIRVCGEDCADKWEMSCSGKEAAVSALKCSTVVVGYYILGLEAIVSPEVDFKSNRNIVVISVNIPETDDKNRGRNAKGRV